jgi:peptidoglycan-N-acetylglucosamine deacetylase
MTYKKLYPALLLFIFASCSPDAPHPGEEPYAAGVVFTFDDNFADEWCDADEVLSVYDWKATFFITQYSQLSQEEKNELYGLERNGHEIAGHGHRHIKASVYTASFGADRYIKDEIEPMIQAMGQDGFTLKTFSYPYGDRNIKLDNRLYNYFDVVRGTTYGQFSPDKHNCFYTGNRLVYGLGIDHSYAHANVAYLKSLMLYAKEHNKIVVFYGHRVVDNPVGNCQLPIKKLKELCGYANELGLRYYTMSELYGLD